MCSNSHAPASLSLLFLFTHACSLLFIFLYYFQGCLWCGAVRHFTAPPTSLIIFCVLSSILLRPLDIIIYRVVVKVFFTFKLVLFSALLELRSFDVQSLTCTTTMDSTGALDEVQPESSSSSHIQPQQQQQSPQPHHAALPLRSQPSTSAESEEHCENWLIFCRIDSNSLDLSDMSSLQRRRGPSLLSLPLHGKHQIRPSGMSHWVAKIQVSASSPPPSLPVDQFFFISARRKYASCATIGTRSSRSTRKTCPRPYPSLKLQRAFGGVWLEWLRRGCSTHSYSSPG